MTCLSTIANLSTKADLMTCLITLPSLSTNEDLMTDFQQSMIFASKSLQG
jgi:hypothetical protein